MPLLGAFNRFGWTGRIRPERSETESSLFEVL